MSPEAQQAVLAAIADQQLKPIHVGTGTHVHEERYEVNGTVYSLAWCIGDTGEPDVEPFVDHQKIMAEYFARKKEAANKPIEYNI